MTEQLAQQTKPKQLEDAKRLFGVTDQGQLDELLWRFRSIQQILEDWERDESADTVTEKSAEKESDE